MRIREIKILLQKEFLLEWRQRYAFNGILLYVGSTIFICYLSFNVSAGSLNPLVWNVLYWIIILFASINSVAKSFMYERTERLLYYQTLYSPNSILIAKIIYNFLLLLVISGLGMLGYATMLGNPIQDMPFYLIAICLGLLGLSSVLTLVSSMAAKAGQNTTLMAIMSFPIILPILLNVIKISKNAVEGLSRNSSSDEILLLSMLNILVFTLSLILFPYVWKS